MGRLWVFAVLHTFIAVLCCGAATAQEANSTTSYLPASPLAAFNRDLVDKVKRSCIYITAVPTAPQPNSMGTYSFWIGSGVIFMALPEENAALALTNHHVGSDTLIMKANTWDRHSYRVELLTTDPGIDTAVLKILNIPPDAYEVAPLGNSDMVRLGEPCLAVGAPGSQEAQNIDRSDPFGQWGLHQTTTMGIIGGIETSPWDHMDFHLAFQDMGKEAMTNLPYRIKCMSVINGGNSGGPLFNSTGELIGLNHATSGSGLGELQYFTIPINSSKKLAFEYLDKGTYEIPWFGMDVLIPPTSLNYSGLATFIEKNLDLKTITVFQVRHDSAAERAGLKMGDIIIEFDGLTFNNLVDFRRYVFNMEIGKQVPVVVERNGREVELTMEVGIKRRYDSEFSL